MMETKRELRLQALLQSVQKNGRLHLQQAAEFLKVSGMTIRRDLSQGPQPLLLLGGYIVLARDHGPEHYFITDQETQHIAEKQQIAQLAAALIPANETVFFDCGSTVPHIIRALDDSLSFTALTASMNSFLALQQKKQCRMILSGGEFQSDNGIFTPRLTDSPLNDFCPGLAFISAAGLDEVQGVTCFNHNELAMKHFALQRATRKVLVLDSSKFGKVRPARIASLDRFDTLITDTPLPPALAAQCEHDGLTVLTPELLSATE